MREIYIKENESGQRFDKFLKKYLSEAPGSFLYKMLRKKNIVLNGRKATGSEKLKKGDQVKLFLADETLEKFTGKQEPAHSKKKLPKIQMPVVYEDEDVVFYNKPAGVLSQKAKSSDVSVVEYLMEHLQPVGPEYERPYYCRKKSGGITEAFRTFQRQDTEKILPLSCERNNR